MKYIEEEFGDKPEEDNNNIFQSIDKESMDRQRMEEDMFIRTNLSKKEKAKQEKRKQFKDDTLEDLASFRKIAAIDEGTGNNPESLLKKRSMRQIIENLGNKNKKTQSSGDDEINPRPMVAKKKETRRGF